jgi:hypothetical protein
VIGDDWPDLPLLQRARFACAVPDAHVEVRAIVHHVTAASRRARRGARILRSAVVRGRPLCRSAAGAAREPRYEMSAARPLRRHSPPHWGEGPLGHGGKLTIAIAPPELHLPDLPEVEVSLGALPKAPQPQRAMRLRLRELLGAYLPLLLMALLALGTWWLVKNTPRPSGAGDQPAVAQRPRLRNARLCDHALRPRRARHRAHRGRMAAAFSRHRPHRD